MQWFPPEQFIFLRSEDFFKNPESQLHTVHRFLDLRACTPSDMAPKNAAADKVGMNPETSLAHRSVFDREDAGLTDLIGTKFTWC
ncbi:MAG: hypothetical protein J6386_06980 [Candidatus Synoicihabitans palmerolidicus]|nr:hypothetical protein [Candidatus Synoicihabitans palmerolidicus]